MKKIILFILLTTITFGQSKLPLLMGDGYKNPETTLYLAGQTVSGTQATRIDAFITMLKDSLGITSLSSKFDVMYLLANETSTLALRNLVKRSSDATAEGAPTFTQWEGYAGTTNKYINTHYNPATYGGVFTRYSASLGVYSRTNATSDGFDIGNIVLTNLTMSIKYTDNNFYFRVTQTSNSTAAGVATSSGLFVASRTANDAVAGYRNSVNVTTAGGTTVTAGAVQSADIFICCYNNNGTPTSFTTRQYSFAFAGIGLTATEVRQITNCIEVYMDALGKGVIP